MLSRTLLVYDELMRKFSVRYVQLRIHRRLCEHSFFSRCSNHCERPGRVVAIWKGLKTRGLDERCTMIPSRHATKEEILLVHSESFYAMLEGTKTATSKELKALGGAVRSINYSNVREYSPIVEITFV